MENKIITLLNNKMSNNLTLDEIVKKLNCSKEEVINIINFLESEGVIYKDKNNKYTLLSKTSLKKGIIKVTKRKGPIVVLDNGLEYDWLMCDCLESDYYDEEVEDELDKSEECDCYEEY